MADLDKVRRNIKRMIDAGAPEADIDAYLSTEKVTLDELKRPQEGTATRLVRQMKNAMIPGGDRISALIGSGIDMVTGQPGSFGENYDRRLKDEWSKTDEANRTAGMGDILAKTAGYTTGGIGLMRVPFLAAQQPINTLFQAGKESARVGAPVGALQAYADSRADTGTNRLLDTAAGAMGGAAIGFGVPYAMAGLRGVRNAGNSLVEAVTQTRPADRAAMQARLAEMEAAGVPRNEVFGPALRDQPDRTAISLSNSVGGGALRQGADANIARVQNIISDELLAAGGARGRAVGEDAQAFLRQQMFGRNVPEPAVRQMDLNAVNNMRRPQPFTQQGAGPIEAEAATEYNAAFRGPGPAAYRQPATTLADDNAINYRAMDLAVPPTNRAPIAVTGTGNASGQQNQTYRLLEELRGSLRSRGLLPNDDPRVPIFNSPASQEFETLLRRRIPGEIVDSIYSRRPISIRDMRSIRSEIRNLNEVPPGQRTWDDAYVARMEGALTDDIYGRLNRPGMGRAVTEMQRADQAYAAFKNDIQEPLRRVFGENIAPEQAARTLVKAAQQGGDLQALRSYYNVAARKGDVNRATASIISHMAEGGVPEFLTAMRSLSPEARRLMFAGNARPLGDALSRLERIAGRLEPYANIGNRGNLPDMGRVPNVAVAGGLLTSLWAGLGIYAGQVGISRFMSSPRYVNWLTRAIQLQSNPNAFRTHIGKFASLAQGDGELGGQMAKGVGELLLPPSARAAPSAQEGPTQERGSVADPRPPQVSPERMRTLMETPLSADEQRSMIQDTAPDLVPLFDNLINTISKHYPQQPGAKSSLSYDLDPPSDAPPDVIEAVRAFRDAIRNR